ncbi:MAG: hypothetical protein KJ726_02465 [Verrucomicrobia bacterium]|nr:hypothetical protein [Verrucomicrobiota bacterium]MBU1908891.1 hypothetical protein [Verrucomicrobiota bacterium]
MIRSAMWKRLQQPGILTALWALWLTVEYWGLGAFSYVRIHDNASVYMPLLKAHAGNLGAMLGAQINGWLCGMDRLSNIHWWTWFSIPFLILPDWLAHGLVTFVQRWIAAYFTFRLLQEVFHAPRAISWAGALVYPLIHTDLGEISFMHQLNEPGLPLLLWFFGRLSLRYPLKALGKSALLGLTLGWCMSHVLGTVFLVPAAWLFIMILHWRAASWKTKGLLTLGLAVFGVVATFRQIPELQALAANVHASYRGQNFGSGGVNWGAVLKERLLYARQWWLLLVAALAWLLGADFRRPENRALLGLLGLGLVAAPLMAPLVLLVGPYLGFARGVDFTRFEMVSGLALTLSGVLALQRVPLRTVQYCTPEGRVVRHWPLATVAAAAVMWAAAGWSWHVKTVHWQAMRYQGSNWSSLFRNADLARLSQHASSRLERIATVAADQSWHPGYLLAYGAETPDGHSPVYSLRYYRFWTGVVRPLLEKDAWIRGFHQWGSYVYLHRPRVMPEARALSLPFSRWYNLDLLSLAGTRYLVANQPVDDGRLIPLPETVREERMRGWVNLSAGQKLRAYLQGKNPGRQLYLYENPQALPRFFLVPSVELLMPDDLWSKMESSSLDELRGAVLVERDFARQVSGVESNAGPSAVQVRTATAERYEVEVETRGTTVLVCANQYYPWWTWTMDGRPAEGFPAYGCFLGIVVPEGKHLVTLEYKPRYAAPLRFLRRLFSPR